MLRMVTVGCLAAALVPAAGHGAYCMREVPVTSGIPGAAPRGFAVVEGADYPLVVDGGGRFWAFGAEGALSGPHDPGLWIDVGSGAASPEGRTLLVGGREQRMDPGPELIGSEWHTRLMESVAGVPTPLDSAVQRAAEWVRGDLFWSDLLGGFVGSSAGEDGQGRGSWVLRGGRIEPLAPHGLGMATDLPALGAVALAGFPGFSLAFPDGGTVRVAALGSGETPVWKAIHETRDPGWIYVDGYDVDHVLLIDADRAEPAVVRHHVLAVESEAEVGLAGNVARYLTGIDKTYGREDGLGGRAHAGACRRFSAAIGRMIFCDDFHELRAGALVPIGDGGVRLTRYLGDVPRLGVALFGAEDGRLHAYDGETLRPVGGEAPEGGLIDDLPGAGRTFVSSLRGGRALFELRGSRDAPHLLRLQLPRAESHFMPQVREAPDGAGVLLITGSGIYELAGRSFRLIWQPPAGDEIRINGWVDVRGWRGTLIFTEVGTAPYLLTQCER